MKEYTLFAKVYDEMMDRIPYEDWKQYLMMHMYRVGVPACGHIAEVGCGTGTMTGLLSDVGFKMTGIDLSEDMLRIAEARQKQKEKNRIEYICADMRDFSLREKQDAVISVGDSMNYLLSEEDLAATFISVKKCLKPGGVFIFDLKTDYFFGNVLDGHTYRDRYDDFLCIWKNVYNRQNRIHEYHLRFKSRDRELNEYREVHRQRAFSADEIIRSAKKAGFTRGRAYGAFTFDKPVKNSERWYIILINSEV